MGEPRAEVVRMPMGPTAHPRRRLVEELGLRFPRLRDLVARLLWRLPTRFRRALARRYVRIGWEAFNRQDLEAVFMLYHDDCECLWDPSFPTVGIPLTVHGREERIRVQQLILDEWQNLEFTPQELIQFDDRLLSVGHMRATGLMSQATVDTEWVADFTIRGGHVVAERITVNHSEALTAAGLTKPTVARA